MSGVQDRGSKPSPATIHVASYGPDDHETLDTKDPHTALGLRGKRPVLWLHVERCADSNLVQQLGQALGLHPLALEDVLHTHQQVKVEDYGDYLFIVARMLVGPDESDTQQISIFLGRDFVVTFAEGATRLMAQLRRPIETPTSQLRRHGCDHLVYSIIDSVLDEYFPLLESFGERLDDLEDVIADHLTKEVMSDIHDIRVELRSIRRVIWRQRDSLNSLLARHDGLISDETRIFLRDCHDHTIQLIELLEVFHETCTDLRDVYMSAISNRMNEIMTVLTIIATIFIPLSFVTGLYGMNFNPAASPWNMPELNWYYGYPYALALMIAIAGGLLLYFRKRGWLGHSASISDPSLSEPTDRTEPGRNDRRAK